ncbi:uncharacterized protein TNCV_5074751 [Trichonephila clavipes]|nr:uncharacterized protein TNCV_5074751 [Trichonephila clavipes]
MDCFDIFSWTLPNSDDENEMNNATPDVKSSEMSNTMKRKNGTLNQKGSPSLLYTVSLTGRLSDSYRQQEGMRKECRKEGSFWVPSVPNEFNGDRYRAMITNFFIPELNNHDVQELWFQQDGATCHTARATIYLLNDTFGDRLISRFGPVNWPPRSCDLTPLDYFLWGLCKVIGLCG